MPFTPYHFGAGALFKGLGGRRFSFLIFAGSQVLIDLEPAYRMIVGDAILHGPTHTLFGATLIGATAMLLGKPIAEFTLRHMRHPRWKISWSAAGAGAFAGTFSHLLLDGVMHHDMAPWAPFTSSNPLLGIVSLEVLHLTCVGLGVLGGLLIAGTRRYNGASGNRSGND